MAVSGDREEVTAVKPLVTHQAFDECNRLAIRRPAWNCDLKRRFVDGRGLTIRDVDRVNLSDPPIVVARSRGCCYHECFVVWRPIVIVDVEIFRRNLAKLTGGNIQNSDPLIMNRTVDDASRCRSSHHGAATARAFDVEKCNLFPIARPTRSCSVSVKVRKLFGIGTVRPHSPELALLSLTATRKNCQHL